MIYIVFNYIPIAVVEFQFCKGHDYDYE